VAPFWRDPGWKPCVTSQRRADWSRVDLLSRPLSRKYAYQFCSLRNSRVVGRTDFLKSPAGNAEDQLVVQFQGMIAEYERAQIAERCRRGKRHRAQQGMVNVLSGAPYGYRYVRRARVRRPITR